MKIFYIKMTGMEGWVGASGLEEARYFAGKAARLMNLRVLFVGVKQ